MRAALGNDTVRHDEDFVRVFDGGQSMRHDERRAPLAEFGKGALNLHFGHIVERAGRLVENEHGRIFEECPSDGNALLLSAGEFDAPFADLGIVAVGQAHDVIVNICAFRGENHFRFRLIGRAVHDIVADTAREQEHVLRDHGDFAPKRFAGNVVDIDGNFSAVAEIETGQEVTNRRLSPAGGADERDRFALFYRKGNSFQYVRAVAFPISVAESHVVEYDVSVHIRFDGVFGLIFGGHIHELAKAAEARQSVLNLFKQRDERAERRQKHGNIENERGEIGAVYHAEIEQEPARDQSEKVEKIVKRRHAALKHSHRAVGIRPCFFESSVDDVEFLFFGIEGVIRLCNADAGDGGFYFGVDFRNFLSRFLERLVHAPPRLDREKEHKGNIHEHDERQPGINKTQHDEGAENGNAGIERGARVRRPRRDR